MRAALLSGILLLVILWILLITKFSKDAGNFVKKTISGIIEGEKKQEEEQPLTRHQDI